VHGPIGLVGDDHDDETKAERSVEQPGPTVVSQCDVLSVGGPQITGTTAPHARAGTEQQQQQQRRRRRGAE